MAVVKDKLLGKYENIIKVTIVIYNIAIPAPEH